MYENRLSGLRSGDYEMKIGDIVTNGNVKGKLIRFQPKTQDLIIVDKNGQVQTILSAQAKKVE